MAWGSVICRTVLEAGGPKVVVTELRFVNEFSGSPGCSVGLAKTAEEDRWGKCMPGNRGSGHPGIPQRDIDSG